ncbi:MAG TPA: hypothetical protein VKR31_06330 [Rhizomicrobium sp.]|nr:hypothetical protein [Rhizomicrobium sp.]
MIAVAGTAGTPEGILDLTRFGVKSSNRDNWAALQAAFDSAGAKNCPVFMLPAGNYHVSRPLRIQHSLTLLGAGAFDMNSARSGSVIEGDGFPAPILAIEPADGERLRGFCVSGLLFHCHDRANGLSFRRCADFSIAGVGVRNSSGFGIELRNCWDAMVLDAFLSACGTPDAGTGAINIIGEGFADNSNSLHFIGARTESSRGPGLVIHGAPVHTGPNNNIQFVASKFHHPAGDGSVAPTPNLVLGAAEAISFHGTQVFDAGKGFPVIQFAADPSPDHGCAFFGCDIDVRAGAALFGGDLSAQHFFGCTLRTDPGASAARPLHQDRNDQLHRFRDSNNVYRILR